MAFVYLCQVVELAAGRECCFDEACTPFETCPFNKIIFDEAPQGREYHLEKGGIMLMTLIEVILCVIVHLFDLPADANAGMDECVLGVSWHVSDSAIDGGYGVNGRWPSGFGLIHKTQLGVRVGSLNPFAEKHIFAVNVKGIGMVGHTP